MHLAVTPVPDAKPWVTPGCAAVAATAAAVLFSGSPTVVAAADAGWRGAAAALLVLVGARAAPWTWVVVATLAAAGSSGPATVIAGLALVASIAVLFAPRRPQYAGAVVLLAVTPALFDLDAIGSFGGATLLVALAVAPLGVSAWRADLSRRPAARRLATAGAIVLAVVVALSSFGLWTAYQRAADGVGLARGGLGAVGTDSSSASTAAADLDAAATDFDAARRTASSWWMAPAKAVPVLAQHVEAVERLSGQGVQLTREIRATIDEVDLDTLVVDGTTDLDALRRASAPAHRVLDAVELALDETRGETSGWLFAPAQRRIDAFEREMTDRLPGLVDAVDAIDVAPDLLGGDGPRRYLVLLGNPAESRELGGFVGSYGFLTADDGRLEFEGARNIIEVSDRLGEQSDLSLPDGLPRSVASAQPDRFAQNWSSTPDFPTVAELATTLVPQIGLPVPDGVLYADPTAFAALLSFTGPVEVEGFGEPISTANAVPFLQQFQYLAFDGPALERREIVGEVAEQVFDRLIAGAIPPPRTLVDVLGPLVAQRRLLFVSADPEAQRLLDDTGLSGALGDPGEGHQYLLTQTNLRLNKLDSYLERAVSYDVAVGADDVVRTTVTVAITNNATATLDPYIAGDVGGDSDDLGIGTSRNQFALYSTSVLDDVTVDGRRVARTDDEVFGRHRYGVTVEVAPGTTATLRFALHGSGDEVRRVTVLPAATASADHLTILAGPGDGTVRHDGIQAGTVTVDFSE